jgi:hypothetical protein
VESAEFELIYLSLGKNSIDQHVKAVSAPEIEVINYQQQKQNKENSVISYNADIPIGAF